MCLATRCITGENVAAVDGHPREAIAGGPCGDRQPPDLLRQRHADGVAVVLAHEDDRQLVDAREVHRLVHLALVCGSLAEVRDRHHVVAAHPRSHGDPHRVEDLGPHR